MQLEEECENRHHRIRIQVSNQAAKNLGWERRHVKETGRVDSD